MNISGFSGWFKKTKERGSVHGVYRLSEEESSLVEIKGNWDEELSIKYAKSKNKGFRRVWKKDPEPENWDEIYNLSIYSLQLNKISEAKASLLPPSDSRLRPDQRALESGDLDLANTEKDRLEEKQRQLRKAREINGEIFTARYFKKVKKSF